MREKFPDHSGHIDADIDSTKLSEHSSEESMSIPILSNKEEDDLLFRTWTREIKDTRREYDKKIEADAADYRSLAKKACTVSKSTKPTETPIDTAREQDTVYV